MYEYIKFLSDNLLNSFFKDSETRVNYKVVNSYFKFSLVFLTEQVECNLSLWTFGVNSNESARTENLRLAF